MSDIHIQDPLFRRFYSHLKSAVSILQVYDGSMPFAHYIRNHFSQHKKFGSKDRKQISELCYCYFRLGHSYAQLTLEQKIIKGYQLSKDTWATEWISFFEQFNLPDQFPDDIFPLVDQLSAGIDSTSFIQSHLVQPDLFLRIRPGRKNSVIDKLQSADIPFKATGNTLRLNNSSKVEEVLHVNRDIVVQDLSSQRVGELLLLARTANNEQSFSSVWDCCAASGGKSILAHDVLQIQDLVVSDIRPSIIFNLKKRFQEAQMVNYNALVADATTANPGKQFDLIIADVPCSGSGTWARTPERLQYFKTEELQAFADLQLSITGNVIQYLKPGGYLLYITCSVFAKENEEQVYTLQNAGLHLVEQRVIEGYQQKADTMFAALLRATL